MCVFFVVGVCVCVRAKKGTVFARKVWDFPATLIFDWFQQLGGFFPFRNKTRVH